MFSITNVFSNRETYFCCLACFYWAIICSSSFVDSANRAESASKAIQLILVFIFETQTNYTRYDCIQFSIFFVMHKCLNCYSIFFIEITKEFWSKFNFSFNFRKCTSIRKHFKLLFTLYRVQHLTTSSYGRRRRPPTVTNVKVYCGVSPGKAFVAPNVVSSAMKNVKTYLMQTAYRVSHLTYL